ncbi:retroelement silencing factor 1 isoform 2-T2 [Discoglossus pictus]
MDWNRGKNLTANHVALENPQYLMHATSTTGSSVQNHAASQNAYNHNIRNGEELYSKTQVKSQIIQRLLSASSNEEILKVQNSLMESAANISPRQQQCLNPQGSGTSYNASYNNFPQAKGAASISVQHIPHQMSAPIYKMQSYGNPVQQIPQSPVARGGQMYGGNGCNAGDARFPSKHYQAIGKHGNSQQRFQQSAQNFEQLPSYHSARPSAPTVRMEYRPIMPNMHTACDLQKGAIQQQQYASTGGQNVSRNRSECAQSQQANLMQNCQNGQKPSDGYAANTTTAPVQMQLLYNQTGNSAPNFNNVQGNTSIYNQSYNLSVQKPLQQSLVHSSDQSLGVSQQPSFDANIPVDTEKEKQELFRLLSVYHNVRATLTKMAFERKIRKQSIQSSMNSLHNSPVNVNANSSAAMVPQLQTLPVVNSNRTDQQNGLKDSSVQMRSDSFMKLQDVYMSTLNTMFSAPSLDLPNRLSNSDGRNVAPQNNCSVFDGGQTNSMHLHSDTRPTLSSVSPKEKEIYDSALKAPLTPLQTKDSSAISKGCANQYNSNANHSNGNLPVGGFLPKDTCSNPQQTNGTFHRNTNILQSNVTNVVPLEHVSPGSLSDVGKSSSHLSKSNMGNDEIATSSLEALETCLALWKYNSKNISSKAGDLCLSEAKRTITEITEPKGLTTNHFGTYNENTLATGQKQEIISPNTLKASEPQIAIVSPLVQPILNAIEPSTPKDEGHCPIIQAGSVRSLLDLKNTLKHFVKDMENVTTDPDLEKLEAGTVNFVLDDLIKEQSKEMHGDSGNVLPKLKTSPPPLNESHDYLQISDGENKDASLQISGICSLAEGNTFYNSSIAMIFDNNSLKTDVDSELSKKDDMHELPDPSKMENVSNCAETTVSLKRTTEQAKVEPSLKTLDTQFSLQRVNSVSAYENSAANGKESKNIEAPSADIFCANVESSSAADQLSELLTEFPFGLKNYISECNSECVIETYKNTNYKIVEQKISMVKEENVNCVETVSEEDQIYDLKNISDSPVNIQITVLEQEEISKLFPDNKENLASQTREEENTNIYQNKVCTMGTQEFLSEESNEVMNTLSNVVKQEPGTTVELHVETSEDVPLDMSLQKRVCTVETQGLIATEETNGVQVGAIKTRGVNEVPDKNLFCCLFSWLTHAYGSAPKCSCKLTKEKSVEQSSLAKKNSATSSDIKSFHNMAEPEPCKREPLKSEDHPLQSICNDVAMCKEKLSSTEKTAECKQENYICEPKLQSRKLEHHDRKTKRSASFEDKTKFTVKTEPISPPPSLEQNHFLGNQSLSNQSHPTSSGPLNKTEKLIVKTDFLKNKHLQKEKKRKNKSLKRAQMSQDISGNGPHLPTGASKNLDGVKMQGKPEKIPGDKAKLSSPEVKPKKLINGGLKRSRPSFDFETNPSYSPTQKRHMETVLDPKGQDHKNMAHNSKKVLTLEEYLRRKREREWSQRQQPVTIQIKETEKSKKMTSLEQKDRSRQSGNGQMVNNLNRKATLNIKHASSKANREHSKFPKSYSHLNKDRVKDGVPRGVNHKKERVTDRNPSSKDKLYLSPCTGVQHASEDGINLTKLEVRPSPGQSKFKKAKRRSLEPTSHAASLSPALKKHGESPKMIEFKLFPELLQRRHSTYDKPREMKMDAKEKLTIEGNHSPSMSSAPNGKSTDKDTARQVQDSKATFDTYKKLYLQKRSKSVESNIGSEHH